MKRIISLFLSSILVLSLIPVALSYSSNSTLTGTISATNNLRTAQTIALYTSDGKSDVTIDVHNIQITLKDIWPGKQITVHGDFDGDIFVATQIVDEAGISYSSVSLNPSSDNSTSTLSVSAVKFQPGTYHGEGQGFGGIIKVEVTVSATQIEKVTVTENSETLGIGSVAVEKLPGKIVEAQSTQVDVIASATIASNGILEAVNAALKSAEVESVALSHSPADTTPQPDLSNFQKQTVYNEGCFSDVSRSDWYASGVQGAFEFGLMKGYSENTFGANDTLTVAETIALAARLHSIYNGNGDNFKQESPWYQVYVDYAIENKLISSSYSDYSAPIYRGDFAFILKNALPETALAQVNSIEDGAIPDLPRESYIYNSIYTLYRAGILTGNDEKGTFTPDTTITRAAVAAIVTRMVDPNQRQHLSLSVDYSYLVGADFRRIRRDYSNAVAIFGTWEAYTNSNGEKCVVTYVKYKIISHYDECVLHNLTTGEVILNPEKDFKAKINRSYGTSRLHLYDLYQEFLNAYLKALDKYSTGDYLDAEYLNL